MGMVGGPQEWIGGDRRWRRVQAVLLVALGLATANLYNGLALSGLGPVILPPSPNFPMNVATVGILFGILWVSASEGTPVRRIALSTLGVTFDFGLRRRTVPWSRVRISGPRRLEAWSPLGRQQIRLTPDQENRIFRFFGIAAGGPQPPGATSGANAPR